MISHFLQRYGILNTLDLKLLYSITQNSTCFTRQPTFFADMPETCIVKSDSPHSMDVSGWDTEQTILIRNTNEKEGIVIALTVHIMDVCCGSLPIILY